MYDEEATLLTPSDPIDGDPLCLVPGQTKRSIREGRTRFERIYEENSHLILAYALRRTDTAADASDVVAETFLVAWRRLEDVPEGERARLWLYATARRVLANHYRGKRRARELSERVQGEVLRTAAQLDTTIDTGPDGDALQAAFSRLKDDDQEVLTLVGVEQLDRDQVAEVLGGSRANVRVRLHRARRRFAKELKKVGIDPQRST
ncbi:MAG TPA: sigma-70 family RNA polymerase sigma factor [Egibacteraceae bacterium]|nr:sigma-70 family RNA polymerase sigma factor [Egibacteraceae bacterium]